MTIQNTGFYFSHLVEARAQQSGDLLDQGVRAEEGIVALGQPLHLLLVLVELLQVISRHGGDIPLLGLVNVSLVSEETNFEFPPGDVSQPADILLDREATVSSGLLMN